MYDALHVTSGDFAGEKLECGGVGGEILVWHDILYDGPRNGGGWPDEQTLAARARFLTEATGGGLDRDRVLATLRRQYRRLESATSARQPIVLWFDACLFDQSMLAHLLACLSARGAAGVELLVIDAFPGIEPFDGLGQLTPAQLASRLGQRRPATAEQFSFAARLDSALAGPDWAELQAMARLRAAPLPWAPAAVARWLQERPDPVSGLGRLERLALEALREGIETPRELFAAVAARDTHPQFWGDTTLWAKLNALADRRPPLARIEGPTPRLPQWGEMAGLKDYRIVAAPIA